tara:strand:+ start:5 stop:184 length:180 start_codon:yes stop_codon:yes gene_type:complete
LLIVLNAVLEILNKFFSNIKENNTITCGDKKLFFVDLFAGCVGLSNVLKKADFHPVFCF